MKDADGVSFTVLLTTSSVGGQCSAVYEGFTTSAGSESISYTGCQNTGTSACQIVYDAYINVLSLGTSQSTTTSATTCASGCGSSVSLSIQSNSLVWQFLSMQGDQINTTNCGTITGTTGQSSVNTFACQSFAGGAGTCGAGCGQLLQGTDFNTPPSQSPGTNTYSATYTIASTCASGTAANCFNLENYAIELQGSPGGPPISQITQCYGNCGTPAITLVNTNSTHTINFNQSITLFYEFQSNLNGFIQNVTISFAKTLFGNQFLGVYEIPSCNLGSTPFTAACPGQLQQSQSLLGLKGKNSMVLNALPVSNGQWVGISITSTFSGVDINDTNTNVNLFQTNEGRNPAVIQAGSFLASSKMSLWAWIKGNVVTGQGPTSPSGPCQSIATLDCFFTNLVNSFCSDLTLACQTSSAVFWTILFTVFTMGLLAVGEHKLFPNARGLSLAGPELGLVFFFGYLIMMAGIGLVTAFVMAFFIMVISLLFAKNTGRFF